MAEIDNSKGPALYQRDENGLLKNIQYEFNEDGSVNWRAMIRDEHLFPNKDWFLSRNKDVPKNTKGLEDNQLLIKLSGIKELAKLRGFSSVGYTFEKCGEEHVAAKCNIEFIKNYETSGEPVYFEDSANATLNNTSSFATKFLETIACNRAFVRCVRNFLNIHIVGDDEIDKSNSPLITQGESSGSSTNKALTANAKLENACAEKGLETFEEFKENLRDLWAKEKYRNTDAKNWSSYSEVPPKEARILINIIKSS